MLIKIRPRRSTCLMLLGTDYVTNNCMQENVMGAVEAAAGQVPQKSWPKVKNN